MLKMLQKLTSPYSGNVENVNLFNNGPTLVKMESKIENNPRNHSSFEVVPNISNIASTLESELFNSVMTLRS